MSYMGKVRPTIALVTADIADDAVTAAKIAAGAVGSSEIATDAVDTAEITDDAVTVDKVANAINTSIAANTAKVTNATHTGDVTGATALTIATDAVDIAMLSATGTASSSTFLRGDNAWAAAGGANTPFFQAGKSATDTIYLSNTWVKVTFDDELIDTDGDYDPTTNYRFTPTTAGKYFIGSVFTISSTKVGYRYLATLYFNGANNRDAEWSLQSESAGNESSLYTSLILTFNGSSDYVESYFRNESDVTVSLVSTASKFWGYKLIE